MVPFAVLEIETALDARLLGLDTHAALGDHHVVQHCVVVAVVHLERLVLDDDFLVGTGGGRSFGPRLTSRRCRLR
jgi:hypothetical protein